jgi:Uncharacterized protein conserved in bacteria
MNTTTIGRTSVLVTLFFCAVSIANAQISSFPLSDVRLEKGVLHHAQEVDKRYLLELDEDRLLYPFYREAGIPTTVQSYGNWENTGLDGHVGGHYLSALALMYAATNDTDIKARLDKMVAEIVRCQSANHAGYVGGVPDGYKMWEEIRAGNIRADNFSLNGRWVPLYNIHKLFAGLYDAHVIGGNTQARTAFLKLCDWFAGIVSGLSDQQLQNMLRSEHGGINEVFALAAELSGNNDYLILAKRLSHQKILSPLLKEQDSLTGLHANTQIPKVIGFKKIADLTGDASWKKAADYFWHAVVENRSVSIGGNSVREHFHPTNDFSSMISSNQGPETCNTHNMLKLTKSLFLSEPKASYIDYYEKALFNHILSSQHPDHGGLVYFTPMRPRHYRVYSNVHESFWCCVGSGIENHAKYGELIYSRSGNDLWVNLFVPSTLNWKDKGITVTQKTSFPEKGETSITVSLKKASKFKMYIRQPGWAAEGFVVKVNGKAIQHKSTPSSFAVVERQWKSGDVVTVELPMKISMELLPDGSPWGSFVYGPIVLAAVTDSTDMVGLVADDSRMGHVAEGKFFPVDEAPVIVKRNDNYLDEVKPIAGRKMAFTAKSLIYPATYQDVELVPFFSIHDRRYMIYWPITTPEGLQEMTRKIKEKEQALEALKAQTIDEVMAGEQQSEVEHKFKGESTASGWTSGHTWRSTQGWFGYELIDPKKEAKTLRVTYIAGGQQRKFTISINDKAISSESPADKWGDETVTIDYPLTEEIRAEKLTLKFEAATGSNTGRIISIVLLR